MMRTVEAILVIGILASAFVIGSFFAVLPSPRQISSVNLQELALTTLQMLDQNNALNQIVFESNSDASWGYLQTALTASLPPNILYSFTVYNVNNASGTIQYTPVNTFNNTKTGLGTSSKTASIVVPSSNVTFSFTPQKIPKTLYILNCSDANGWWITGYTGQALAYNLLSMLSPYFNRTVMVQTTAQLGRILNGSAIQGETVKNATVMNPFGETVPIPSSYASTNSTDTYASYCYELGKRSRWYNWTWVSIVGWPFYYVSNTVKFSGSQNSWGIYGMIMVGNPGLKAFLMGLDGQQYTSPPGSSSSYVNTTPWVANLNSSANYYSNYYGVHPSPNQTSTRALSSSLLSTFDLTVDNTYGYVFRQVNGWIAGATYSHRNPYPNGPIYGSFTAIGVTRIPDIRIAALALLMYYHPTLYPSASTSSSSTRLVVLQLGLQGGG